MYPCRQRGVYFYPRVPSIDEPAVKPHFLLVVSTKEIIASGQPIEVIGLTSTPRLPDDSAVRLLTRADSPSSTLLLTEFTFAIARWRIAARVDQLRGIDYRGYVTPRELIDVLKGSASHPVTLTLPD